MSVWRVKAALAIVAALPAASFATEPNDNFSTATMLAPGLLTVADDLSPRPDTLLGVRDHFGVVYATDDDGSPVGNGYASGLGGVPTNSGVIDFSVTGFGDDGFVGAHSQSGAYRVYIDVYDFFDDLVDELVADRVLSPGIVHDFYYENFEWIQGSYDVYIDNTLGGGFGDVDFFTFTGLTPGAQYTAKTADPLASGVDTLLGVFDDFGQVSNFDDDGGGGVLSQLQGVVPAGGALTFAVSGTGDLGFLGNHVLHGDYELRLTLGGGFAADFDNSGGVRGADLAIWKSKFGANVDGDADNDNDTDGADLLVWQRELGSGGLTALVVPEPGSVGLVGLALLCCGFAHRRR
jgi:hypothetical protein